MANELTLVYELEPAVPFTVSNTTGIEKGTLMKIADPLTASASAADEDYIIGVAASEKIANDGKTKLGVYMRGIFKVYASGNITAGQSIAGASDANFPNYVKVSDATCVSAKSCGIALETAATGETLLVLINVGTNANAYS